mmetsp:Transcript_7644/g.11570  ORF Transcript_7644/g.11570 Transcript_7644/m.11570 type:complete len:83 (-) Transcript_7644:127-375(-)
MFFSTSRNHLVQANGVRNAWIMLASVFSGGWFIREYIDHKKFEEQYYDAIEKEVEKFIEKEALEDVTNREGVRLLMTKRHEH